MAGNSWFRLVWGAPVCLRVKENMWESSSEIYSAQYKPLEQKVDGVFVMIHSDSTTLTAITMDSIREKKTSTNPKSEQSQKNWLGHHQQKDFYFILVTNSHSSVLKMLWCRHCCSREHWWIGNAAWPKSNKPKAGAWEGRIEKNDCRKKTWAGENDFAAWLLVSRLKRKDEIKVPINSN